MTERSDDLILRYQLDKVALNLIKSETRALIRDQAALRSAVRGVAPDATVTARALRAMGAESRSLDRMAGSVKGAADDMAQLRAETIAANKELARTDDALSRQKQVSLGGLAGGIGMGGIGGLATTLGVPGVGQGLAAGSDIVDAVRGVKLLKEQLPGLAEQMVASAGGTGQLVAGLGAAGLAVGATALVLHELAKSGEEAVRTTERNIKAYARYAEFDVEKLTTEQVREKIALVEEDIEKTKIQLALTGRDIAQKEANRGFLKDTADDLGLYNDGLDKLKQQQEDLTEVSTQDAQVLALLYGALNSSKTAANDAAAAEKDLAEQRNQQMQDQIALELRLAEMTRSASSDQVKTRIDQNKIERDLYQQAYYDLVNRARAGEDVSAGMDELVGKMNALDTETEALTNSVLPLVAAREAETKAIEQQKQAVKASADALQQLGQNEEKRQQAVAQYDAETAETTAKRRTVETREAEDFARKRIEDQSKQAQELAALDEQYYGKRADILTGLAEVQDEGGQERAKYLAEQYKEDVRLAVDHRRKLVQIERETKTAIQDAAATLDARAVIAAMHQGERQIADEQEQYGLEKQRREEDRADRLQELEDQRDEKLQAGQQALRDLDQQHQRERTAKINAFADQLRREDENRRIALSRQQADWASEDAARQAHFAAEVLSYTSHGAKVTGIVDTMFSTIESRANLALGRLGSDTGRPGEHAAVTGLGGTGTDRRLPRALGTGGYGRPGESVLLGDLGPEWVTFMRPSYVSRSGAAPVTNHINIPIVIGGGDSSPVDRLRSMVNGEDRLRSTVRRVVLDFFEGRA